MFYELIYEIRPRGLTFEKMRVFEAEDEKEAKQIAHLWCKDYYGKPNERNEDIDVEHYEFQCGCIAITIKVIKEIEDKQEWLEEHWRYMLIERHMVLLPEKK